MEAVQYIKSVPRYLFVRALGGRWPFLSTGALSCIRLAEVTPPALPGDSWVRIRTRLSGICGSDLSTIRAKGSPYFSPMTSCPFVFGHEVVGDVSEVGAAVSEFVAGDRVILEPALCCIVRGIDPVCDSCRDGAYGNCERIMHGDIAPGIQTGYCRDTGGGWSEEFVAHAHQLHKVSDALSDEEAVLIEPFSCCVHAAIAARPVDGDTVLVIGCGTIGLLTIAALRAIGSRCRILAVARYGHQQDLARNLGADEVVSNRKEMYELVRTETGAESYQPEIGKPTVIGGVHGTFDCVGTAETIDDSLRLTRSHGTVAIVGMPGIPSGVDWTTIWYKELRVQGTYAYGTEHFEDEQVRTFALALRLLEEYGPLLKPLVSQTYPLSRYRAAIQNAIQAGRMGAVKVAFDLRTA
ncbi:MAG: alcohol dehydrogenase catalytic domain-containing protein [Candidatus Latescibacteria bacterium]|nr:alcohol dehydrogenase catalytic domain-containing protein [Candidatus Latescibacterota bacterium]